MHRSPRRRRGDSDDAERACTRTRRCSRSAKGKHVQVEIPMSLNLPDAQRMVAAAKKAGKICMVTHTRRFSSPHREIRRRIQEGTFHLHHMVVETYFFRRDQPQHARPGALVGRQPAVAPRLPFGRSRAVDRQGSRTGTCGARRARSPRAGHPDGPDGGHEVEEGAALHDGDVVQQQGTVRRVLPLHRRRGHLQGVPRFDDRQRRQGRAARRRRRLRPPGRRVRQRDPRGPRARVERGERPADDGAARQDRQNERWRR